MKVWSDTLGVADLHTAALEVRQDFPGCQIYLASGLTVADARKRALLFDKVNVRTTHGIYRPNSGTHGAVRGEYAGSYAEHGWWMARVFAKDPNAFIRSGTIANGEMAYDGVAAFHDLTYGAFVIEATPRELQVQRTVRKAAFA